MIQSIFRYIVAREVYGQYSKHKGSLFSMAAFQTLGNICWSIIGLALVYLLAAAYAQDREDRSGVGMFMLISLGAFFLVKSFDALFKYFKNSVPVYGKQAVYKPDKRYKTGQRVEGYKEVIQSYKVMTSEELAFHRKQQLSRLLLFTTLAAAVAVYIYYLVNI